MSTRNALARGFVLVLLGGLVSTSMVWADCGSVPYRSPLSLERLFQLELLPSGEKNVKFDPLDVVVYEPGQRGIILWNGEEQILLLSTEIRTNIPTSILEVIPFPAEPSVKLGDFSTFEKMQRLVMDKAMWQVASGGGVPDTGAVEKAARITFYEKMGAHDLAVVQVENAEYFTAWVAAFMHDQGAEPGQIDPEFIKIIGNYVARGYRWFVFDTIDVGGDLRSHEPVEFRFKTDHVYYPLEISTREHGKTQVDLLLVTRAPMKGFKDLDLAVRKEDPLAFTANELQGVSEEWAAFMQAPELTMQRVKMKGNIAKMKSDFILRD